MGFAALLLVLGVHYAWACDYAKYPDHTMCIYSGMGCKVLNRGVSQDQINVIVDTHNKLRSKVARGKESGQPSAANMKELTWDPELAKIAQRWADQCIVGHDEVRSSHAYDSVGQNFGMLGSSARTANPDLKEHINNWYEEVANMKRTYISSYKPQEKPREIGHYTQLVWANTEKVGCGLIYFKDGKFYTTHLICNYGPSGNYRNSKVYEIGSACSKCSKGCSTKYKGLCAP